MKTKVVLFVGLLIYFASCAAEKPYYKTAEGKKKLKYYNDIQFGRNPHPKMNFWSKQEIFQLQKPG